MTTAGKRKESVTVDAAAPEPVHVLGLNVSEVADTAPQTAVPETRRSSWLDDNADAFARQAAWHKRNDHPLADILVSPGKACWRA